MANSAVDRRPTEQTVSGTTAALTSGVDIVYLINATVNLPASPTDRRAVVFWNTDNATNSTIGRGGHLINGAASDYTLTPGQRATLYYTGGAWYDLDKVSPAQAAAIAAKAPKGTLDGVTQDAGYHTVTGTTDSGGKFIVDFSSASGSRPALASAYYVGACGVGEVVHATVADTTVSAFEVDFTDVDGNAAADAPVILTVGGILA